MTLVELIRRKHGEHYKSLADSLVSGGAKDYSDYRFIVGRIQGMADLMREIEEMLARYQDDVLDDTGG